MTLHDAYLVHFVFLTFDQCVPADIFIRYHIYNKQITLLLLWIICLVYDKRTDICIILRRNDSFDGQNRITIHGSIYGTSLEEPKKYIYVCMYLREFAH